MADGKYAAISGAVARMHKLDNISEHLASARTPGYKKGTVTFAARLGEATSGMASNATNFTGLTAHKIDFSPGQIEHSGNPLNVAINGEGFFQIQRPDGELAYTRKGSFQLNGEGLLIDSNGYAVTGPDGEEIILDRSDIDILGDGSIWIEDEQVAQIGLFLFEDTGLLQRAGKDLFVAIEDAVAEIHPQPQMVQNSLESSNVNLMEEMARMTANLRAFEATQKALKTYSDMNAKATELGVLQ
jgi:flagellar basal body rod protein FlgG